MSNHSQCTIWILSISSRWCTILSKRRIIRLSPITMYPFKYSDYLSYLQIPGLFDHQRCQGKDLHCWWRSVYWKLAFRCLCHLLWRGSIGAYIKIRKLRTAFRAYKKRKLWIGYREIEVHEMWYPEKWQWVYWENWSHFIAYYGQGLPKRKRGLQ